MSRNAALRAVPVEAALPDRAEDLPGELAHAAGLWREHDLMIRRFHNAALAPDEIAVVLNSKGLKVRTWHVSESFVRKRLKALRLGPNASRLYYQQGQNRYRER
jgi:hypothetical protein